MLNKTQERLGFLRGEHVRIRRIRMTNPAMAVVNLNLAYLIWFILFKQADVIPVSQCDVGDAEAEPA